MNETQKAKLDIIVNMGGGSPADAKKLLDALKEVEKTEKEIAAAAEKHRKLMMDRRKEAEAAQQKGMGVVGGALSGGPVGALSAMGGTAGAVAGVIQAAEQGFAKAARAAEILATANTTAAQRSRMLAEEMVPFAASFYKLRDAITGVAQTIHNQNQQFEIATRGIDARQRFESQDRGARSEANLQLHRVRAQDRHQLGAYGQFDRGTVGGMHGFQEQAITLPARDALRSAQVEQEAARGVAGAERMREDQIRDRIRELEENRGRLAANLASERGKENGGQNGIGGNVVRFLLNPALGAAGLVSDGSQRNQTGVNAAALAVLENERQLAAQTAALQEQMTRAKEAGVRAAEAESRVRRAMIDVQKAELEVLRMREQRMAGIQQAAGSMSRGQFAGALRAVEQVRRRGIGNVSAQTAAMAGQLAPEFIQRERERLGGERMAAARGRLGAEAFGQVYGQDFSPGNTLADVRRNQDRVQAEVRVAIQMDERQLASSIASAIEPVFRRLKDLFDLEIRRIESEVRAGAARQSNATNGAAR